MKTSDEKVYCFKCDKKVAYHYNPINHWKNLFITVLTLGIWLPIWLSMTFSPTKLCNQCNDPLWDSK